MQTPPPLIFIRFLWKMRNMLKRKKINFPIFFFTYGRFCTKKNWPILGPVPTKDMQTPPPLSFDPVFMDDAECAE